MRFLKLSRGDLFELRRSDLPVGQPVDDLVLFGKICGVDYFFSASAVIAHLNGTEDWTRNGHHSVYNTVPGGVTSWLKEINIGTREVLAEYCKHQEPEAKTYNTSLIINVGDIVNHPKFGTGCCFEKVPKRSFIYFTKDYSVRALMSE